MSTTGKRGNERRNKTAKARRSVGKVQRQPASTVPPHSGMTRRLRKVGNATGILLPKEVLEKLRVGEGDVLHIVETPRGIMLTPYDPEFAAQMDAAELVMREDRDALRRLAE